jgi:hypothetical protein
MMGSPYDTEGCGSIQFWRRVRPGRVEGIDKILETGTRGVAWSKGCRRDILVVLPVSLSQPSEGGAFVSISTLDVGRAVIS